MKQFAEKTAEIPLRQEGKPQYIAPEVNNVPMLHL
jgi:hypothetical protein